MRSGKAPAVAPADDLGALTDRRDIERTVVGDVSSGGRPGTARRRRATPPEWPSGSRFDWTDALGHPAGPMGR